MYYYHVGAGNSLSCKGYKPGSLTIGFFKARTVIDPKCLGFLETASLTIVEIAALFPVYSSRAAIVELRLQSIVQWGRVRAADSTNADPPVATTFRSAVQGVNGNYIDSHPDLAAAFSASEGHMSKSDWGEAHYGAFRACRESITFRFSATQKS